MIVYRISNEEYKDDISGSGAAVNGSRWNSMGVRMLYSSEFISLCILESLVHLRQSYIPSSQYLLQIELPQTDNFKEISVEKINKNWNKETAYTQWMGDQFINSKISLVLKIPSAIVPQEHNFLINPLHKDFKKIKIVGSELLELDKRLLQT
jgi:RES domain-containing protein